MPGEDPSAGDGESTTANAVRDVFISYASQDKVIADSICAALELSGLRCWIAPRDVSPGEFYADAIVRALNEARVLVLVLTENAAHSPHVLREVERTSSKRHAIVSLRINDVPLPPALEYFLSASHWLDATAWNAASALPQLVQAVKRLLDTPSALEHAGVGGAAKPAKGLLPSVAGPGARHWLHRPSLALVFAIALGAALFALNRFWVVGYEVGGRPLAAATPTAPAFNPPPHSIAVLPFVNMSGDATQEYFSDGISEELLDALSRLNQLHVAARTSAFSFKGRSDDIPTIARKLNVGAILEGSVRRSGGTVRITVQLIDASSGYHIWSQTYDRSLNDILRIQTEVAGSVARQLAIKLSGDQFARLELGGTRNPGAHDAYLRGYQIVYSADQSMEGFQHAKEAFDRAIELDPRYALAFAGRARAFSLYSIFLAKSAERSGVQQQALVAGERAVELARDLGEAHLALAFTRGMDLLDFKGAAPEFDRALTLAPGNAQVVRLYAIFASTIGHHDQALSAALRARSLDPQNLLVLTTLAQVLLHARRFDDAIKAFQGARELDPGSKYIEGEYADALLGAGQFEKARQLCADPSLPMDPADRHLALAMAYDALGRAPDAERELRKIEDSPLSYAQFYGRRGDKQSALRWLVLAEQRGSLQQLKNIWTFDGIRGDPGFQAIEARMKFPP